MSGKFNWDKVNKEKLARTRGSEWIEDDLPLPESQSARRNVRAANRLDLPERIRRIVLDQNAVGLATPSRPAVSPQDRRARAVMKPAPEMTLTQFAAAIKGVRQHKQVRNLLSGILKMLANEKTSTTQQKRDAGRAISAMLSALSDPCDPFGSNAAVRTTGR
jgi:hypothetical protein